MQTKKIKKRHLNIARTLVFILFIYLVVCFFIYVWKEPVRHYEIVGNNLVKDVTILRETNLSSYPSFVSISVKKIQKKLEENPFIKKAKVSYGWNYTIKITIEENKPVMFIKSTNEICLADSTKIENQEDIIGIPTLLNDTPLENIKILAENLSHVEPGIFSLISEIEYRPSYNQDKQPIDKNRFLLSMVDGNLVYITAKNAEYLNNYLDVVATDQISGKGTIYLDGNQGKYPFVLFSTTATTTKEKDNDEN